MGSMKRSAALGTLTVISFSWIAAHAGDVPLEVSSSYVANLVHWIDNLAGSSQGKTVQAYRRYWSDRFGAPGREEMSLLGEWVDLRWKRVDRPEPRALNEKGCLPQLEDIPDWRQTFRVRSYEATTVDGFVESMKGELTPEEMATLRKVIEKFRPRFDEIWPRMTFLQSFEDRFRAFLKEGGLTGYLTEVAWFFGVDPAAHPPGRIHLIALPVDGPTHAQADGRDLLIEIRPNDTPVEQIQVVSHEMSHYLWHLVTPERNDSFARQVHAAGPHGPVTWNLLREALPTALGQGLAEEKLAPYLFREHSTWYHIETIDRLAKKIYPVVADAFREKKRIDDGVLAEIGKRAEASSVIAGARPSEYLATSFFAVGDEMWKPFAEVFRRSGVHNSWPAGAADPNGAAFAERYECLSGVVLLGPQDLGKIDRLPKIYAPPASILRPAEPGPPGSPSLPIASPSPGMPASADGSNGGVKGLTSPAPVPAGAAGDGAQGGRANGPAAPSLRSTLHAFLRPGGGTIYYLIARRPEDIDRIGAAFIDLKARPEEAVLLPESGGR